MTRSVLRAALAVMATRVVGAALQVLSVLILARSFTTIDVGAIAILWAMWVVARVVGPLGLDQCALRYLSAEADPDARKRAARWQAARLRQVWAGLIGASGALSLFFAWGAPTTLLYIFVALLGTGLSALQGLYAAQIRAYGSPVRATLPESILIPAVTALGNFSVGLLPRAGDSWLPIVQLLSLILAHLAYRAIRPSYRGADRRPPPNVSAQYALCQQYVPGIAATAAATRAPMFIVSALLGLGPTAFYEIAQRVQNVGVMATSSMAVVITPQLARMAELGTLPQIKTSVTRNGLLASCCSLGGAVIMLIWGDHVLLLFGPQYAGAQTLVVLLLISAAVNAAFGLAGNALVMLGRGRFYATLNLAYLISTALAVSIGVHLGGLNGAGVGVLVSILMRDGTLWLRLQTLPHRVRVQVD